MSLNLNTQNLLQNLGTILYLEAVEWLKNDWNTTIVRAAMGVDEPGGYLSNISSNKNRVKIIIESAIDQGIYVIIDWHSHHAENFTEDAIFYFLKKWQAYMVITKI